MYNRNVPQAALRRRTATRGGGAVPPSGHAMSEPFDAYHQWLGIPPADQPPNHYRLLGLALFESDPNVIANAADRQMAHLRSFATGKHSAHSQRLLNEVAGAKVTLLKDNKKGAYDAALRAKLKSGPPPMPPAADQPAARSPAGPPPLVAGGAPPVQTDVPRLGPRTGGSVTRGLRRKSSAAAFWIWAASILVLAGVASVVVWKVIADGKQSQIARDDANTKAQKRSPPLGNLKQPVGNDQPGAAGEADTTGAGHGKTTEIDTPGARDVNQNRSGENAAARSTAEKADSDPPEPMSSKRKPAPRRGRAGAGGNNRRSANAAAANARNSNTGKSNTDTSDAVQPNSNSAPIEPAASMAKTKSARRTFAKATPPTPDEREAVEKQIRELLADEFAAGKKPASKKSAGTSPLALVLMQRTTSTSEDPTATYVLLDLARQAAMEAGDAQLALRALDRLISTYDIDSQPVRLATLSKLATTVVQAASQRATFEAAWQAAVQFVQDDEYDQAAKALKLAQSVAARAKDNEFARQAAQRVKDVAALAREYNVAKASLEKLVADPDDAEANLVAGRWLWFGKGRFDKAVAHLAKGADADLKAAATSDIASPGDTRAQLVLADLWMAAAEKRKPDEKNALEARAFYWYLKASANAAALDDKVAIEKRIEEIRDRIEKRLLADAAKPASGDTGNTAGFLVPGVVVEYFADTQLQRKLATATSATIRSEFTHDRQLGLPPGSRFTARWTGWIVPIKSGPYKIRINTRGAFWLDGKPLIGPRTNPPEALVEISARPHHIRYEMSDVTLGMMPLFHFHAASEPAQSVGADAFFHVPLPGEAPVELKRTQINPALRESL